MTDRIEAALAALDKATPGPWADMDIKDARGNPCGYCVYEVKERMYCDSPLPKLIMRGPDGTSKERQANAILIAAAPDLAAEVIRLRKWQSDAVEWLRWFCENVEESWSIPPAPDLNRLIAEAEGE